MRMMLLRGALAKRTLRRSSVRLLLLKLMIAMSKLMLARRNRSFSSLNK